MNIEYKLSGKSGNIWLIGLPLGIIGGILLSIIYAYVDVYNPLVYLTFLVFVGYLIGITWLQKLVVRLSKCRNTTNAYIYGALVGLFSFYASWCTFLFVLFQKGGDTIPLIELLSSPLAIFKTANLLSVDGYYELFKVQVKGGFLWTIWVIEALGILLAGIIGGAGVLHEEVFCENCNRWAENTKLDLRLSIAEKDKVDQAIKEDVEQLTSVSSVSKFESRHFRLNMRHCSNCDNFSTIDVDLMATETNEKGEFKENEEDYSPVFVISNSLYRNFLTKKQQEVTNTSTPG